jgi:hypothetical protein
MHSPHRTRLTNATRHPGLIVKAAKHRTTTEVKAAAEAKQATKDAKQQAKVASIHCAAAFESTAMADEDLMDATPQPNFNSRSNILTMDTEMEASTDIEMSDGHDFDQNVYNPPEDITENDLMDSEGFVEDTLMPLSRRGRQLQRRLLSLPPRLLRPSSRHSAIHLLLQT